MRKPKPQKEAKTNQARTCNVTKGPKVERASKSQNVANPVKGLKLTLYPISS